MYDNVSMIYSLKIFVELQGSLIQKYQTLENLVLDNIYRINAGTLYTKHNKYITIST